MSSTVFKLIDMHASSVNTKLIVRSTPEKAKDKYLDTQWQSDTYTVAVRHTHIAVWDERHAQ